ncbi:hypothetical protein L3X38_033136 [Prunus dulcis]|uniref:Uncharacterized protein n=1 Tax=Prunus dulcis TaxID=3755 RepID=A0AAD4VFL2_PRUDU|nr:hypothetical protein L3X38_033136 [Prunus dulcis]
MLDSGNFVTYNAHQEIVWQSFRHTTDTLLPGQRKFVEEELFSPKSETDHSTGIFCLKMQDDGNLFSQNAYYSSGTAKTENNVTLNFDVDGHLYLLNNTGSNIRNTTGGNLPTDQGISYLMRIDADGILQLYSNNILCGLNSYCMSIDLEAECRCLPGFESASQRNDQTSGCARNLVANFCKDKNENFTYTMQDLPSTVWENVPYLVLTLEDKEACKQACLEDCNCKAALFNHGSCLRERLPLRYRRRQMTTSNIALIKGGISTTAPEIDTIS